MVDEPVDHGGCDDVVGEDLAPPAEGHVRGDEDRALFVAGHDELKQQVRGVVIEGDLANLVDDDELVSLEPFRVLLEASGGETTDPVRRGVEQHRVAGLGGLDAKTDREVSFADAGRTEEDDVSAFAIQLVVARWARISRRKDG